MLVRRSASFTGILGTLQMVKNAGKNMNILSGLYFYGFFP